MISLNNPSPPLHTYLWREFTYLTRSRVYAYIYNGDIMVANVRDMAVFPFTRYKLPVERIVKNFDIIEGKVLNH